MTILELRGLSHAYNGTGPVLRGVNLLVEQGEFVGIIGLSGSGKSTLLRCINRLVEPCGGAVLVPPSLAERGSSGDPIDILRLSPPRLRRLRRRIGMIFQQFHLVPHLNALENVMLAQYFHSIVDRDQAEGLMSRMCRRLPL